MISLSPGWVHLVVFNYREAEKISRYQNDPSG
jgi:hypothetical protein